MVVGCAFNHYVLRLHVWAGPLSGWGLEELDRSSAPGGQQSMWERAKGTALQCEMPSFLVDTCVGCYGKDRGGTLYFNSLKIRNLYFLYTE